MSSFYKGNQNFEKHGGSWGMPLTYVDTKTGQSYKPQQLVQMGATPDAEEQQVASQNGWTGTQNQNQINAASQTPETINASDMAQIPRATDLIDPATGLMKTAYQLKDPAALAQQQGAVDKISGMANDTGLTPYAQAMMARNSMEEQKQLGDLSGRNNTQVTGALHTLGTTGGYDSGARERVAAGAARSYATGGQNIGQQSAYQRLGIQGQDEADKMNMLKALPGMYGDLGKTQMGINTYNIDKATGSIANRDQAALDRAKLSMQNLQNIRESQAVK